MNGKIIKTLEFSKIIHTLAGHAETSLGKERVEALLPSPRLDEVKRRLAETDEASHAIRIKGSAPFGGIRNVMGALRRAQIGGMLNPTELYEISQMLMAGRKLTKFLQNVHESRPIPLLTAMGEQWVDHRDVEDRIKFCIDDVPSIMDSASPELSRIRHELRTGEARVREKLDQMIRNPSVQKMLQENLVTIRGDRYVIPVKQEYRGHFGGVIHDQSASGATLFIEPEAVLQLNNKLREWRLKEEVEIEKILLALSALVAESADTMRTNLELLTELDFIFAKAELARGMKATLPLMNDRGFLKIKRGRHPLLAKEHVVPLDVELGNRYSGIIVTGPNTGGKTVSLKTIGLLTLMAMSGLFVPAEDDSLLCVFDAIYADIGDEQSIEQNLSTFSSHMTNIISILREMTPKSLVLLDEVGAGTDPAEGSALAIAILEHIHAKGCRMVATTHYSELKAYAYERSGIVNASMEFDIATLSPTYRLLVGVPGRSNAFAIAERLGLDRMIIDHARGEVSEDDQRVETMIATLEENRLVAVAERHSAEQQSREVGELRSQLEAERRRYEQQRDKLLEKAQREADVAVAKARAEAEAIIADLRQMVMEERTSIKEHKLIDIKRRLNEASPTLKQAGVARRPSSVKSTKALQAGDEVRVQSLNQRGRIIDISGKEATVQMGIMKMKLRLADLEEVDATTEQKAIKPMKVVTGVKRTRDENVKSELDMRGMNLEESIVAVDQFLDESFLANFTQVYLIHGKGTGVLRTGIQEFLRKHKLVKSYRNGNYGEGGTGVTIAELE